MVVARLSHPALAFSRWCGLRLILRAPVAISTGMHRAGAGYCGIVIHAPVASTV